METIAFRNFQNILRLTFGIVPIVAGLDKFTNLLTDWAQYLNPLVTDILPISAHAFMMIVGVIEIVAGILVLSRTEIGGFLVAAWLVLIALNLITQGRYLDVAVRDLVMAISSFTLARMTVVLKSKETNTSPANAVHTNPVREPAFHK